MSKNILGPLSAEQSELFTQLVSSLNKEQTAFVSGYLAALSSQNTIGENSTEAAVSSVEPTELTILYGSRTGNGEGLAKEAQKMAVEHGLHVHLKSMKDYKPRDLEKEKNLLIIVSTHGDGVPAFNARELHEYIHGNRAPKLDSLNYAVLALGDKLYFKFCKVGIEFDEQLAKLGGKRIAPRIECDTDFRETAPVWLQSTLKALGTSQTSAAAKSAPQFKLAGTPTKKEAVSFTKNNPFSAPVLEKIQMHGKGSDRQTVHIELKADVKGLEYEPGDAAGIIPLNDINLVDEVLNILGIKAEKEVQIKEAKISVYEALYRHLELSKITVDVIQRYAEHSKNKDLQSLIQNQEDLKKYLHGRDIIDLLKDYPTKINAEELVKILRPLQARYYSISSSPKAFPGEVHLTVGVVNYENAGRKKNGACSTYLSEVPVDDEQVPLFIEKNPNFRLPENDETAIIMVGAGTGIAPYRAFVQHRDAIGAKGKNWLFFGNRNFETEFLYQTEWQDYLQSGALTKLDVAFSRDSEKKEYVQHRLLENAKDVYQWLEDGAHFYICGDMKAMAGDVQNALVKIVETEGLLNKTEAQEYVDNLQKERRLQLDVY